MMIEWVAIGVAFGITVGLLVYFTTPPSAVMPPEGMNQSELSKSYSLELLSEMRPKEPDTDEENEDE